VDPARIAEWLAPFLATAPVDGQGPAAIGNLCAHISTYIDLLLRWNSRINLTAIRDPEEIVTRHFGESLFAARILFPVGVAGVQALDPTVAEPLASSNHPTVADIGSGAGFPGLPLKLWAPRINLTLVESNQKKVAFLREVIRALTLMDIDVFSGRAETLQSGDPAATASGVESPVRHRPRQFHLVTLRAVERFEAILPTASRLVAPGGRLALLITAAQVNAARHHLSSFTWHDPVDVPFSHSRVLLVGSSSLSVP
jgi:16S rRNA (guanine527-N7)-methyltransferase